MRRLHSATLSILLGIQVAIVLLLFTGRLPALDDMPVISRDPNGWDLYDLVGFLTIKSQGDTPTTLTLETNKGLELAAGSRMKASFGTPGVGKVLGQDPAGVLGTVAWVDDELGSGSIGSAIPPIELISGDIGFNIAPLANETNPDTSDTLLARRLSDGANVEVQIGHLPFSGGSTLTPPAENQVAYGNVGGTDIASSSRLTYDPVNGILELKDGSGNVISQLLSQAAFNALIFDNSPNGDTNIVLRKADTAVSQIRFHNGSDGHFGFNFTAAETLLIRGLASSGTQVINFDTPSGSLLNLQYEGAHLLYTHTVGASRTTNLNLGAGSSTIVPLSSSTMWESVSTMHDTTTNPSHIYYRDSIRSGLVAYSAFIQVSASTDNNTYLMQLLKNGTPIVSEPPDYWNFIGTTFELGTLSGIIGMTDGDRLELSVYQNSGATRTLQVAYLYFARIGEV